ncbi:hypothetical protein H6G97_50165 [Nostoc flagelliforme FACHB-838]|uniref:Transposase n=1 Tax=Nostoc flagelliforme FACHB-838 TaxID=2692904 RepID=A0ABR8E5B8_9NOSO|nr:hypothetical protein [Nostoc flagelliforme]MBD2536947.1 hypothetical protein [Nostoc flagelliforme FACHB-838]
MNKNKRELLPLSLSNKIPKMLPGRVKRRLFLSRLIIEMSAVTFWGGEFFLRQNPITLADIANQKKLISYHLGKLVSM